jgi:putative membrane protein
MLVGAQDKTKMNKDKAMQSSGALSSSDKKFIMDVAHDGMKEIETARLALEKASSDEVKQYAQRLIDDHTKAGDELMQLASQKGVTMDHDMAMKHDADSMKQTSSTDPAAKSTDTSGAGHKAEMDKEHAAAMNKLSSLSGTQFDKEFIRAAVKDHEKAVKAFEKESTKADDADVRAFATKTLPTLQEHLQMARDLDKKMSGGMTNK